MFFRHGGTEGGAEQDGKFRRREIPRTVRVAVTARPRGRLPRAWGAAKRTLSREACLIYSYLTGTYGFRATPMCARRVVFRAPRVSAEGTESPDKGTESERKGNA